jgi:hypothetical protein
LGPELLVVLLAQTEEQRDLIAFLVLLLLMVAVVEVRPGLKLQTAEAVVVVVLALMGALEEPALLDKETTVEMQILLLAVVVELA